MSSASIFRRKVFLFAAIFLSIQHSLFAASNEETHPNRFTVSADFLYWYPSEEVASIWADVITSSGNTSSWKAQGFDFDWDYGFRLGVGYKMVHDEWDTALYWTWFRTDATHTLSSEPGQTLRPEFFAAFLSFDTPRSMSANWDLFFNMFDAELGRRFWLSKNVSLRPFIGIKGGWIDQSIRVKYFDLVVDSIFPTDLTAKERLKNDFWGVGPLGGVNSLWKILGSGSRFFSLFGNFSVATMWGSWACSDVYKSPLPKTSSVNTKDSVLGALMMGGFLGIGWDTNFYKEKAHFALKLGYEMQIWFNQLRIATFQLQRLHDDLTLQGLTLNCQVDF